MIFKCVHSASGLLLLLFLNAQDLYLLHKKNAANGNFQSGKWELDRIITLHSVTFFLANKLSITQNIINAIKELGLRDAARSLSPRLSFHLAEQNRRN